MSLHINCCLSSFIYFTRTLYHRLLNYTSYYILFEICSSLIVDMYGACTTLKHCTYNKILNYCAQYEVDV